MFQIMPESDGKIVGLRASGTLTDQDYKEVLIPRLEALTKQFGRIRLLCVIDEDFAGMEAGAMLDDARFFLSHTDAFEKMALTGGPKWVEVILKIFSPLMKGEIKVFPAEQLAQAWEWIKSP